MIKHGIINLNDLDISQLIEDKADEFIFVFVLLTMKDTTGSPGNSIAIY
ncbi:MAG: hypothetical protein O4861_07845 [Trichodesmium sp. St16_bin4-tuft]|nr:hypothetical protein [Trichodesmium sp. St2_bin6]MDE5098249.1 hypothetical protein [Trichodesmium sp. St16_bin4-tuft]MDE5101559.1 hypothetical protein [Trichodesmium sp. St19_bin2]